MFVVHLKTYLIVLFCLLGISGVSAQATLPEELDSPRERADRLTQEMIEKVGLFSTQIETVDSLNYVYAVEMQVEVFDADLGVWGQYRRGSKIMNRKDIELKSFLTSIQYKKYAELKSEILWEIVDRLF